MTDTIVTVSTPPGPASRVIVRMSGPDSIRILAGLGVRTATCAGYSNCHVPASAASHGAKRAFMREGPPWIRLRTNLMLSGRHADETQSREPCAIPSVVYIMPAPRSYTREDVVEFHLPGAYPLVQRLVEDCVALGARQAGPGEFTRRAFLSGRIDLAQAESISELIRADDDATARRALAALKGSLSVGIREACRALIDIRATLEAGLDFSDQDIPTADVAAIARQIDAVRHALGRTVARDDERLARPEGLHVAIVGRENAGKSTLFNALVRCRKTIVSAIPGTTRDVSPGTLSRRGTRYILHDMAGIPGNLCATGSTIAVNDDGRVTEHVPGSDGRPGTPRDQAISAAQETIAAADLLLMVVDCASRDLQPRDTFAQVGTRPAIIVLNKCDLLRDRSALSKLVRAWRRLFVSVLPVSALHQTGIMELKDALHSFVATSSPAGPGHHLLTNARQRSALAKAQDRCAEAATQLLPCQGVELACLSLAEALEALGEVTGRGCAEDVLDSIFERFCVGK
ncbi:MAG: GTPase [Planctomycetota bacterium]|nr:GTPase [Planctomycetota bacterium]